MSKNENIVSYTAEEARAMLARGEDQTDWAYVNAMEATDPAQGELLDGWEKTVIAGIPLPPAKENKQLVSVRYSPKVIDYFKSTGRGWQARMDAVLSAFVDSQKERGGNQPR